MKQGFNSFKQDFLEVILIQNNCVYKYISIIKLINKYFVIYNVF